MAALSCVVLSNTVPLFAASIASCYSSLYGLSCVALPPLYCGSPHCLSMQLSVLQLHCLSLPSRAALYCLSIASLLQLSL
jgi:hypothetical protein